ncbi:MAG: hypothetical protein Q7J10_09550 [Methanosarcinaceae archaeon]|nr:hypothetical protein [Methanosarcinaceae archaeon]
MNIAQIENNLQELIKSFSKETFIYDLFLAYGLPKASITRLQKGNLNLSKVDGEISWKKKAFFKEIFNQDLHVAISALSNDIKNDQRFVIVHPNPKQIIILYHKVYKSLILTNIIYYVRGYHVSQKWIL